ncbi:MAG: DedA family protein/thiosulfate sulfurtransferase GlpE [Noviherbaspirillum sp.]
MLLIAQYGLLLVFANVLLEQIGLPLPAVPTMLVAGALAADGELAAPAVVAVALIACLIGDAIWYAAGRRYGMRVLRLLCRISISPDSCVMQSQMSFERWGSGLLVVAKFIPGLSTMAPPMAGAMRLGWGAFLVFDCIGSLIWIGASVAVGMLFHTEIDRLFAYMENMGMTAIALLLGLFALFITTKWWQRQRLYKTLRMARISVHELQGLIDGKANPVIVDVRSDTARKLDPRSIPGARHIDIAHVDAHIANLPAEREIILYCTCPNEASAAQVAKMLMDRGYKHVRPLHGGLDAWAAAGYAVGEVSEGTSGAVLAS